MAISFVVSAVFGTVQFFLLSRLLKLVLKGDMLKTAVFLIVKLALYGASAAVLVLLLKEFLVPAAVGYGASLPVCALIYLLVSNKKSVQSAPKALEGDDSLDTGTDN